MTEPPLEFVRFLERAVARHGGTGVVAAAAIEDCDIAWTAAAGGPADALFQAGSLSKTVTSAVALELVERGELDLDSKSGRGSPFETCSATRPERPCRSIPATSRATRYRHSRSRSPGSSPRRRLPWRSIRSGWVASATRAAATRWFRS